MVTDLNKNFDEKKFTFCGNVNKKEAPKMKMKFIQREKAVLKSHSFKSSTKTSSIGIVRAEIDKANKVVKNFWRNRDAIA